MLRVPTAPPPARTARRKRQNRETSARCEVLCIDDDADLNRVVKARLNQRGLSVSLAHDGAEGLLLAQKLRPRVIITDLGMPGNHGWDLIRRLKQRPSTASIPLIVISGLKDQARVTSAYMIGADSILQKPIDFEQLFAELNIHFKQPGHHAALDMPGRGSRRIRTVKPLFRLGQNKIRMDAAESAVRRPLFKCG